MVLFSQPKSTKIIQWRPLGPSWARLGPSRAHLGASWRPLGASCTRLGASWGFLEASWDVLGRLGGVLERLDGVLERFKRNKESAVARIGAPLWAGGTPISKKKKPYMQEDNLQDTYRPLQTTLQRTPTRSWAPSGPVRIHSAAKLRSLPPRLKERQSS